MTMTPEQMIEFLDGFEKWAKTDVVSAKVKAIRDYIRATQWQPIETAPRGKHLLLGSYEYADMDFGGWDDANERWSVWFTPTHYMQIFLPQPPKGDGE